MRLCIFGIVLTAAAICGLLSCSDSPAEEQLASAESVMDRCPDSALSILRGIDLALIHGNREKALYGLLYTQALDKNHEPIQDDSLIRFAVRYFTNIKDKRRSMIANNYRGRAQYMNQNYTAALISFMTANGQAKQLDDKFWIGMTARGIADVYSQSFNNAEELAYAKEEYDNILLCGRQPYINYAMLDLARAYCNVGNYNESNIICTQILDSAIISNDSWLYYAAKQLKGANYVAEEEFSKAICEFEPLVENGFAQTKDSIYMAWAYSELHENDKVSEILDKISANDSLRLSFVKYKISKKQGQIMAALRDLEQVDKLNNKIFRNRVNRNITGTIVDYFELNNRTVSVQLQAERATKWFIIISFVLLLAVIIIVAVYLNLRQRRKMDDKILIAEHLQELLKQSQLENSKNASIIKKLYASKYDILEEICEIMIQCSDSKSAKRKIADSVTVLIESLSIRSDKIVELESEVNALYDNLFAEFRKDLPSLKDVDYRLYLFSILGFSNTAISLFLKEDRVSAVYDRKRHLKDRIKRLDPLKRDRYLSIFQYPFSFCQTISGICDITY